MKHIYGLLLFFFAQKSLVRKICRPCRHHFHVKKTFLCILSGCDGWIRVWDLESICNAKAAETDSEKALFHLDPMNEIEVEAGAELKSIAKSKIEAEDNNDWFIQDASGSIWKVDLSFSLNMQKPSRIYR